MRIPALLSVLALVGALLSSSAQAQDYPDYSFEIGVFGGGSYYTAMLDDVHLTSGEDVQYRAGWVTGAQLTIWPSSRFGIRANGAYTERPITGGVESFQDEDGNLLDDVNLWSASGDLLIRPLADGYDVGPWPAMPYIALGIGAKNVNPAVNVPLGEDFAAPLRPESGTQFWVVEDWRLMGLAGIGTDLRAAKNISIRLELGDRFWDASVRDQAATEEDTGNVIHELYGQIGVNALLGLERREVVVVTPAPPAPEPEPEPEPEPVEEAMMICVVDPGVAQGLREVEAVYRPATGDTMVVVAGERRPFGFDLPDVMLANEADWLVQGEPLAIEVSPRVTLEYTTWGGDRVVDVEDLTYIGDVRGLPVFAESEDVIEFEGELADRRDELGDADLTALLAGQPDLVVQMQGLEYLYVPVRRAGCVFQALQQVEQVLKK